MTTKDEWLALFKASGLTPEQAELAVADLCDPDGNPPPASAAQDGQTERKPTQEEPAAPKQKPALSVRWRFADGETFDQSKAQYDEQRMRVATKMGDSDDPHLRVLGRREYKQLTEELAGNLRFTINQSGKASKERNTFEDDKEEKFSLAGIARALFTKHRQKDLTPGETWEFLIRRLEDGLCRPEEFDTRNNRGHRVKAVRFSSIKGGKAVVNTVTETTWTTTVNRVKKSLASGKIKST
jgi:hypothetical protein